MTKFEGISAAGLELLRELPSFDTGHFKAHRATYAAELLEPLKVFVDAVGPKLREQISSKIEFVAKTHGSIGPINNDVRFNPDASTYKDHILLRFWEGPNKKTAPTLFIRFAADRLGFASGAAFADVDRWRHAVNSDGGTLTARLNALAEATGAIVLGQKLKRVPKPYESDHPHAELLRHKSIQARWLRPVPHSVGNENFVDYCAKELALAADVHRWLAGAVT